MTHRVPRSLLPPFAVRVLAFHALAVPLLALGACIPPEQAAPKPPGYDPNVDIDRPLGETRFVSADGTAGQQTPERGNESDAGTGAPAEDGDTGGGGDDRTVEEGDIYRVLEGGLLANVNAYRGLQLIDVTDAENPRIVGRLQVSGTPVELYVYDGVAFVLMNNWYGYYGSRDDVALESVYGGMVAAIDIKDPTAPVLLDQTYVPGWISKSRLTRGGGNAALYVAAGGYDYWQDENGASTWETRTYVRSFDVSHGSLVDKSELDLGGYVTDIQATPDALLVARYDWNDVSGTRSRVALIDIRDPTGVMHIGDEVPVAGYVRNQFNMDLYRGVLRVVSGGAWNGTSTNHLETFDASNFSNLEPIDHKTFGDGQDLYATLFLGNKAFFVTYLRVDPFHAFSIDDSGIATERSEFEVTGWNDFFRAAFDETRLVGIGVNDEQARTLAVSLYDITDLSNPSPLLARAEVEADYSWSEASWDHRAFSVLENAVVVEGPEGVVETSLVLLPFSGWNEDEQSYTAAVQIFTFSERTLTRRGLMVHGTPVRRSFQPSTGVSANLSEAELSLFDTRDPTSPDEMGRLELAPNYADLLTFGDFRARVKDSRDYYYGWWGSEAELPEKRVEIIDANAHPDEAAPLASVEVPAHAELYAVGDLLVSVAMRVVDWNQWPYDYESDVQVFDLSDATVPVEVSSFTTDRLRPSSWYYYGGGVADCFDCGYYGYGDMRAEVAAVPGALAFLQREPMQELIGTVHECYTYATASSGCASEGTGESCSYYSGNITCRSVEGDEPVCTGNIYLCTSGNDREYTCEAVDESSIDTQQHCYDYESYRYWERLSLEVLDVRDPARARFADSVELPREDEGVGFVQDGASVWLSYKRPERVPGSNLPYVRYFIREANLSNPARPVLRAEVNVPGVLLAVDDDVIFTRDFLWGDDIVETSVNRLQLLGGVAELQGIQRFSQAYVQDVELDGAGRLLVTHRPAWQFVASEDENVLRLSVLDGNEEALPVLGSMVVDSWGSLRGGVRGRALFQVPGGLLVVNLANPARPFAQAYFPTRGWPSHVYVDGRDVLVPAGRFGIYAFDLDVYNLLPSQPR